MAASRWQRRSAPWDAGAAPTGPAGRAQRRSAASRAAIPPRRPRGFHGPLERLLRRGHAAGRPGCQRHLASTRAVPVLTAAAPRSAARRPAPRAARPAPRGPGEAGAPAALGERRQPGTVHGDRDRAGHVDDHGAGLLRAPASQALAAGTGTGRASGRHRSSASRQVKARTAGLPSCPTRVGSAISVDFSRRSRGRARPHHPGRVRWRPTRSPARPPPGPAAGTGKRGQGGVLAAPTSCVGGQGGGYLGIGGAAAGGITGPPMISSGTAQP